MASIFRNQDSQRTAFIICLLGMAFCAFLTTLPDIVAAICSPDSMVWSPVNSLQYRYNDSYYQVPWVRAISAGTLLPVTPSNIDNVGLGFEAVRIIPFWISALPGLIFSDIRFIIVASFIITASAIFALSFAIARQFTKSLAIAASAGIASYFFQAVWAYLAVQLWFGPVNGWSNLTPYGLRLPWLLDITDTAMINSNLRFVSIAGSVPVLLLHYLACLRLARTQSAAWSIIFLATLLSLPFCYPTHAFIGYMVAGGYALLALVARDWRAFIRFTAPILIAGIFLIAIDYPGLLKASRESSPIYQQIMHLGLSNAFDILKTDMPLRDIALTLVFNKYNLALLVLVACTWRNRINIRDVVALYIAAIPVIIINCGSTENYILRALFAQRGIDVIWPIVIFPLVMDAVYRFSKRLNLGGAMAGITALVLFGLPAVSFAAYADRIVTTDAIRPFQIPKSDWDAYAYLGAHARPDREIVAMNWSDIELLPMLYPVNLFVANNALQQRKLGDLFTRYVAVQKFLGENRDQFETMIDSTFRLWMSTATDLNKRSWEIRYPIQSDADFSKSHFAFSILYWPYVHRLDGVTFSTADMKSPTDEFKRYALDIFDRTDPATVLCASSPDLILVRSKNKQATNALEGHRLKEVYQTSTQAIYKFDRASICR